MVFSLIVKEYKLLTGVCFILQQPESELLKVRREKLKTIRDKGIDPYPGSYERTHTNVQAMDMFKHSEDQKEEHYRSETVSVAGRIVRRSNMGKAVFLDLQDGYGKLQVLFRRNNIEDSYENLSDIDIGDWLGVKGPLFRTRTGEVTVEVFEWTLLCKSIRFLPEKWHGLTDIETRYRQRYLDLISNEDARRVAIMRSRLVQELRRFMDDRGFMEVETPVLVSIAAGGTASPFSTHHNALNRNLYLRIATELYLKRLVVGGLEKVYEVGRIFRNEGVDHTHNPEFTMMESYEAFADYNDVMTMVEQLVSNLAFKVLDTPLIKFGSHQIDLSPPWPRITLRNAVEKYSGIDFTKYDDIESLKKRMKDSGLDVGQQLSWGGLLDKLVSDLVEPKLIQPTFLTDYPVEMSPLAKKKPGDDNFVERFEGFIAGMEICNAFTELNDPIDQRQRFEQQELLHSQFQNEDMDRLDEDFLLAIEYGMPPTGGLGIGIDRLMMLFSGHQSIREVVLFPHMRG